MSHSKKLLLSPIFIVLFLILFSLISHIIASAGEPTPFYWEFINVDIDVQENGDMLVTETQKYVFTAHHTNERYRYIPLDKVDDIDSVEVSEEGQVLYSTTGIENNKLWIKWSHELNPPESREFVLKYRVIGGLHIHDDGNQVYWKAIFGERDAPVIGAAVTVDFPKVMSKETLEVSAWGAEGKWGLIDDRTVRFVPDGSFPPGEEFTIQVTFPHGMLDVPVPVLQQSGVEVTTEQGSISPTPVILGTFVLWRTKRWNPSYPKGPQRINSPPSDLPAPVVSILESPIVNAGTILSMVVEMCQRGILTIDVEEKGRFWKRPEYYLSPGVPSDRRWECLLYDRIPKKSKISDLYIEYLVGPFIGPVGIELGDYVEAKGLFTKNPVRFWKEHSGQREIWVVRSLFPAIIFSAGFLIIYPDLYMLALGLCIAAPILLCKSVKNVGRINPTSVGLTEISQWREFKKYLKSTEESAQTSIYTNVGMEKVAEKQIPTDAEILELTTEQFDSYLPYAIALDVADVWMETAVRSSGVNVPLWFHSRNIQGDAAADNPFTLGNQNDLQYFLESVGGSFGFNSGGGGGGG